MNNDTPKISFIPKSSLAQDEAFITRSRPRSVLGFLALITFLFSASSYAGLYFYQDFLLKNIEKKTSEIQLAKQKLNDSSEIVKAKVFQIRANLARELLDKHIVVLPLFTFLKENTIKNIFYGKFDFSHEGGDLKLLVSGEAPTYASLAYQADIFGKNKNLLSFSVGDVKLTEFGSVSFTFTMVFAREYLSFAENIKSKTGDMLQRADVVPENSLLATTTLPQTATSSTKVPAKKIVPPKITF